MVLLFLAMMVNFNGCADEEEPDQGSSPAPGQQVKGCQACHPFTLDQNHQLPCISCHHGNDQAETAEGAHSGLIAAPAHPEQMTASCGPCHPQAVRQTAKSLHFTMRNLTNQVRQAFGSQSPLQSLTEIPEQSPPASILALADDLLRRRCLRCHPYSAGDDYPATRRGTGCAACHLSFANGALVSHQFIGRPGDRQCLSCHYGNTVGADFYGRFEHDFSWEYQTPFARPEADSQPPYGLHYHQLSPDIHQQRGMTCIDCHSGAELMGGNQPKLRCESCHARATTSHEKLPPQLQETASGLTITLRAKGTTLDIPQALHPAHRRKGPAVNCLVCHAQWGFNDQGTHLLRLDEPEFESWFALTRQGSSEVENLLNANIFAAETEPSAIMTDQISGAVKTGTWLKSYELRRWEPVFCPDGEGRLQVCRPLLDLHLSYVNQDGEVIFDSISPITETRKLLPYTPHTVGPAGAFYQQRLNYSPPE